MPIYNDDGEEINPNLFPKPALCATCKHNDDHNEQLLCDLTRMDQREEIEFKCFAYEPLE